MNEESKRPGNINRMLNPDGNERTNRRVTSERTRRLVRDSQSSWTIPPIANRFVAGEASAEALAHVRDLNASSVDAMINRLGSHYRDRSLVDENVTAYRVLIDDIANAELNAAISVKPTQLGLSIGEDVFRDSIGTVVETARERDVFVWVDMEGNETVDATLDAFEELATEHGGGIGVCVQASLKRTPRDVIRLTDLPGRVRFVKGGVYDEPSDVAYQRKAHVNAAYRDLLVYAFETFDDGVAVASHDPEIIEHAISLHEEYGTDLELQMLMGVRSNAQFELAQSYDVRQYVPYGTHWKWWCYKQIRNSLEIAARSAFDRLRRF